MSYWRVLCREAIATAKAEGEGIGLRGRALLAHVGEHYPPGVGREEWRVAIWRNELARAFGHRQLKKLGPATDQGRLFS